MNNVANILLKFLVDAFEIFNQKLVDRNVGKF